MNSVLSREQLASAMATGKPYKSYIKTILGKVYVTIWDIFENVPVGLILQGNPRNNEEGTFVDLYSEYEYNFFRKANKKHIDSGYLVEYTHPENVVVEKPLEQYSDEEIKELINSPFLKLRDALNKTKSVALLFRFESIASDLEKSDKILSAIRSRLSEVQQEETPDIPNQLEDEVR